MSLTKSLAVIFFMVVGVVCVCLMNAAFERKEEKIQQYKLEVAFELGKAAALDTVSAIIDRQIASDTTVTKLVLINPDTLIYYLSPKTILP